MTDHCAFRDVRGSWYDALIGKSYRTSLQTYSITVQGEGELFSYVL